MIVTGVSVRNKDTLERGWGVPLDGSVEAISGVNVGMRYGMPTVRYSGPASITVDTVISRQIVDQNLVLNGGKLTMRDCYVSGGATLTTAGAVLDMRPAANTGTANLIEFNTFAPANPSTFTNCIIGHSGTIQFNSFKYGVDGIGVYNTTNSNGASNLTIQGNDFSGDLFYFSPDSSHTDERTHNDDIQLHGNSGTVIRANSLRCLLSATKGNGYPGASPSPTAGATWYPSATGSGIAFTNANGEIRDTIVDGNRFWAGQQPITAITNNKTVTGTTATITNNRFDLTDVPTLTKDSVAAKRAIYAHPSLILPGLPGTTGTDTAGNVLLGDGTPITVYRGTAG